MAVETQTMPALNGHANGDVQMHDAAEGSGMRFTSGLILPPPEIKCELLLLSHIGNFSLMLLCHFSCY